MAALERLTDLLSALGVYSFSDGSYSKGELMAVGGELDLAEAALAAMTANCSLATAPAETLAKLESLLNSPTAAATTEEKRQALTALLNISSDCFTLDAINNAVLGSGINARVTEVGGGRVKVSFPGVMGIPEGIDKIRPIVTEIIPAHLDTEFFFRYLTWLEAAGFTWSQAGQYSWNELRHIDVGA